MTERKKKPVVRATAQVTKAEVKRPTGAPAPGPNEERVPETTSPGNDKPITIDMPFEDAMRVLLATPPVRRKKKS